MVAITEADMKNSQNEQWVRSQTWIGCYMGQKKPFFIKNSCFSVGFEFLKENGPELDSMLLS